MTITVLHNFEPGGGRGGGGSTPLGLESAMVFEQLPEYMKVFVISIPNESERKSNVRIRNGF